MKCPTRSGANLVGALQPGMTESAFDDFYPRDSHSRSALRNRFFSRAIAEAILKPDEFHRQIKPLQD
jgi:hypothetical protein